MSLLQRALEAYSRAVQAQPLLTNWTTGCVVAGVGDAVCQLVVERQARYKCVGCCMRVLGGAADVDALGTVRAVHWSSWRCGWQSHLS